MFLRILSNRIVREYLIASLSRIDGVCFSSEKKEERKNEKKKEKEGQRKMHSDASNASTNRDETMEMCPEESGAADRVTAMHNALDLPQVRGERVKKNAPLILHQRPTKKAAKNGALPDRATRSNTPMQFRHCIGRSDAHTNPRATLAFFSSLHRGDLRSASYRNLSVRSFGNSEASRGKMDRARQLNRSRSLLSPILRMCPYRMQFGSDKSYMLSHKTWNNFSFLPNFFAGLNLYDNLSLVEVGFNLFKLLI